MKIQSHNPSLSGHDEIIQIFSNEFNLPINLSNIIFSYLSIPYLHKTLGANLEQLVLYVRKIGFDKFKCQLKESKKVILHVLVNIRIFLILGFYAIQFI